MSDDVAPRPEAAAPAVSLPAGETPSPDGNPLPPTALPECSLIASTDRKASTCECRCGLAELRRRSQSDFEIEFLEQVLSRSPSFFEAIQALAHCLAEKGRYQRLVVLDRRMVSLRPHDPMHRYNLACTLARLGQSRAAIVSLEKAVCLGFSDVSILDADVDLASLREHPRYAALRHRLEQRS